MSCTKNAWNLHTRTRGYDMESWRCCFRDGRTQIERFNPKLHILVLPTKTPYALHTYCQNKHAELLPADKHGLPTFISRLVLNVIEGRAVQKQWVWELMRHIRKDLLLVSGVILLLISLESKPPLLEL